MYQIALSISLLENKKLKAISYKLFAFSFLLLTSGCGFHPVYGNQEGSVSSQLASVRVDDIKLPQDSGDDHTSAVPKREAQVLKNTLEDLLDPGGLNPSTAAYSIKSSYNRAQSDFATYVAAQNAAELADKELAEELRSRLIYYFSNHQ